MLYGKYPDVQIDIRPEKTSGVTVSLLFIADPVVSIGDMVQAGKTQLGKVRECPKELARTSRSTRMRPVRTSICRLRRHPSTERQLLLKCGAATEIQPVGTALARSARSAHHLLPEPPSGCSNPRARWGPAGPARQAQVPTQ